MQAPSRIPYRFELAGPEHEAGLRALLQREAMPGAVRLTYSREPDFFAGLALEGPFSQAFVATLDGAVVGMGTRAVRSQYVNGAAEAVGYLGGLRVATEHRRRLGFARGYRLLRQVHGDGRCRGYLSTIHEDNRAALDLLGSARAGLPAYRDLGRLHSRLLLARPATMPGVRPARPEDLPALLGFLAEQGPRRQFFPVLEPERFGSSCLHGLGVGDFWLLEQNGAIRAAVAAWDQRARRQLQVQGYAPWLGLVRPLLNGLLRAGGYAGLPAAGSVVPMASAAFLAVADDDLDAAVALLRGLLAGLASRSMLGLAVVLHECDPLRDAAASFRAVSLRSRLFGVGWEDADPWFTTLDRSLVPHVDAAFL